MQGLHLDAGGGEKLKSGLVHISMIQDGMLSVNNGYLCGG